MFMLCCFSKVVNGELCDRQYHVFEVEDSNKIFDASIIHDSLFRDFMSKGYSWSSVPFPEILVLSCGFTVSKVENDLI